MATVLMGASVVLAVAAGYTDVRWGKVFNALTVPFALLGLILNTIGGGWEGLLLSLGGLAAGFGLWLFSSFLGRILGGGDIKLLMAFGALQGPVFMLWTFVYGALIGGAIALVLALRRGMLLRTFRQLGTSLYMRAVVKAPMDISGSPGEITPVGDAAEVRLPYAIALGLGAMLVLALRVWAG